MRQQYPYRTYLFLAGIVIIFLGMLTSRGLMSIGIMVITANALFDRAVWKHMTTFLKRPAFVALSGIFFLYALSGLWSADTDFLLHKLRIKLPYLVLPFAFVAAPKLSAKTYKGLLAFFLLLTAGTSVGVLINFGLHYEAIVEQYLHAKTIPTPFNHIRYSLMCVLAAGFGYYLYRQKYYWRWSWERYVYGGSALFLFIFLHVLSVRSGLAALYVMVTYLAWQYVVDSGHWKRGLGIFTALLVLPVLAYMLVPTFHNKVTYMARDIGVFMAGENISEFSDSRRFTSMQAAIAIGRESPIIGVGMGDVKSEMEAWYATHVPDLPANQRLMPHSQLLLVFAGTGLLGLLVFGACLSYPLLYRHSYRHLPFGIVAVTLWVSFLVEATIEIQLGTALFSTFWLLTQKAVQLDHVTTTTSS